MSGLVRLFAVFSRTCRPSSEPDVVLRPLPALAERHYRQMPNALLTSVAS